MQGGKEAGQSEAEQPGRRREKIPAAVPHGIMRGALDETVDDEDER